MVKVLLVTNSVVVQDNTGGVFPVNESIQF
jgi:hypothetical protein